ncbi:MAG TPA: Gfo/Idh/MocA family oxidoreductase [Bryobacteraceae bacterium]|nr:Gfo/Idh/MocA family oxidoreductase [Bryobacteraceae bacterium]
MARNEGLTRRDAVKVAGAAGVAAGMAAAAANQAPAFLKSVHAANNQLNYGIIGTGGRGQYLLGLLKGVDNGRCVAICDVSDDALNKGKLAIGNNPKTYKDYRQMLADSSVEAVLIATPVYLHYPMLEDSLKAGKHVFCEKSLVFTPEEIQKVKKMYPGQFPKQVLQVGLQRRYSEYYQMVRQMIDKGVLGDVKFMYAQWHRNPGWTMKPGNWRLFRKTSGGIAAELASHHFDVADWMFDSTPEMVMGLGGLDTMHDGRDIYDNIQLIIKYPKGKRMMWSGSSTTSHLPLFGGARAEQGEMISGTQGTVHITIGDGKMDPNPPMAIWYKEPNPPKVSTGGKNEKFQAGASFSLASGSRALPVLLSGDEMTGSESFVEKELKFARRWLYSKNIMVPQEAKNPVTTSLEHFFNDCKVGKKPKADYMIGLHDSATVCMANLAMDEERRVLFSELDRIGNGAPAPAGAPKKKVS